MSLKLRTLGMQSLVSYYMPFRDLNGANPTASYDTQNTSLVVPLAVVCENSMLLPACFTFFVSLTYLETTN